MDPVIDGKITDIRFSIATHDEICTSSISDGPINHASQLNNPFLGLPLESGKCESCGTAEPGKCEGHFGYIELPIAIYHPCHVSELKKLLTLVCLKCLGLKRGKNAGGDKASNAPCRYCVGFPQIHVEEDKTTDGVVLLELKLAGRSEPEYGFWNFLNRFGYQYGEGKSRILLPCEALEILKRFSEETKKKLSDKGCFPQDGYILQKLPVPPNCLSIPDISDGVSIMSSDISVSMLRKVLKQADIIKSSRSGRPNFESHKVEVNDLQLAVAQYLHARGAAKDSRDIKMRSGNSKAVDGSATKAWLEKMRTFFISKGSGYCSRSVITGDAYKRVDEVGLPFEVAQRITIEEKVTEGNMTHLQELVDQKLCLTYTDGGSVYSLREGSKGHTLLKVGQVVHRRIMDGDVVFINRPPSTHKHSLQALSVYIHEDHTVKINPLICGPLDADFDGDCVHLFYPQSLAARAEVLELFSVEQQMLSSHTGYLNLQLKNDSLLSLKTMFRRFFLDKVTAQQLAMFLPTGLEGPALLKVDSLESQWTVLQILQAALPNHFDCSGERYLIKKREILKLDFNRDILQSMSNEIISSVLFKMGPNEALDVFNSLQPLLMENLFSEGYSVSLRDYYVPKSVSEDIPRNVKEVSPLLHHLRLTYNELVEMQVGNHLRSVKAPVVNFILKFSGLGNLIDSKSESSINKVVEQIGFLGLQLADRGKFYSRNLVEEMHSLYLRKYAVDGLEPEAFGLIKSCIFHGLNPYEDLVHSISSREVLVRSSRGLTEPGTLFKNLMTILRDVVVCYDGTVRNVCSDSIIQFEYRVEAGMESHRIYPAGEPVGALAATAISNPAYKAVLDSSSSSNASWDLMKEVLVCKVNFVNDLNDRRVILYLNDCGCPKRHCKENAAYLVQNQLKRVSLRNISVNFLIEYQNQQDSPDGAVTNTSLVGHIHLDKKRLKDLGRSMHEVLLKCQETVGLFRRRKKSKLVDFLKNISLSVSECCCFQESYEPDWGHTPCLQFSWRLVTSEPLLETTSQIMANMICPILLDTIVKGDRRVCKANIIWVTPDTTTWVKNNCSTQRGELALELVLEKEDVKKHGDAWRHALDSCIPVIHLIDTTRSIPYAIRQVQELLGISCAFDQAVQRLSTSIRMVNKGVLKEHLILAANSMTCTGSLVGFNKAGYRALFRSLNVQIPFTEATLFTPRKCFERAAEKCHTDTLSGIVASCSWGKHVAVGSGARFEILWNTKEGLVNNGVTDVYSFLQLVRTSSNGGESNTSCLGEEYDDLEIGNLSPEHDNDFSKPTFDDAELLEEHENEKKGNFGESNWEGETTVVKSGGKSEWKIDQLGNTENAVSWPKPNECTGRGEQTETNSWESSGLGGIADKEPSGWGASVDKEPSGRGATMDQEPSGWGAIVHKQPSNWSASADKEPSSWGAIVDKEPPGRGATVDKEQSGWGATADKEPSGWGAISDKEPSGWGTTVKKEPSGRGATFNKTPSGWGATVNKEPSGRGTTADKEPSSWGATVNKEPSGRGGTADKEPSSWGASADKEPSGWGATPDKEPSCWGASADKEPSGWGATVNREPSGRGAAVNKQTSSWGATVNKEPSGWGARANNEPSGGWGATVGKEPSARGSTLDKEPSGWGATTDNEPSGWGSTADKASSEGGPTAGWNSIKSEKLPSKKPVDTWRVEPTKADANSWGKEAPKQSPAAGWNTVEPQKLPSEKPISWGKEPEKADRSGWVKEPGPETWGNTVESQKLPSEKPVDTWVEKARKADTSSPSCDTWGKKPKETKSGGWSQGVAESQSMDSLAWDSPGAGAWTRNEQTQNKHENEPASNTWGKKSEETKSGGWSQSVVEKQPTSSLASDSPSPGGWTRNEHTQNDHARESASDTWGQPTSSPSLDSPSSTTVWTRNRDEQETPNLPWGRGKKASGGRGWGSSPNSGDWNQKSRAPGGGGRGRGRGTSTPSRSKMEQYTTEEQTVCVEMDKIMTSIRKIMHESGYNDGDPLSADDQSYILDNVVNYHPDKAAKMGSGIDHVTIGKHTKFQGTRCFYIISSDGNKEDFSYLKCLENFVKEKYPEVAVSFVGKYFGRKQYTTEEQTVRMEMDKITTTIRTIMNESGYTDGDRLSADDQTYIIDNVFNYHPDKEAKIGSGIDYVTINKHMNFQGTRCFYIVTNDGNKEDFSYWKCLENFVKEKYPDVAASFVGKYFRKPTGRIRGDEGTPQQ